MVRHLKIGPLVQKLDKFLLEALKNKTKHDSFFQFLMCDIWQLTHLCPAVDLSTWVPFLYSLIQKSKVFVSFTSFKKFEWSLMANVHFG